MAVDLIKKVMDDKTLCPCNDEELVGIWAKRIISDLKTGKQDFTFFEEQILTIEKMLKFEVVCIFLAFLAWDSYPEHQGKVRDTARNAIGSLTLTSDNIETVPCSPASSQLRRKCYALYNVLHSREVSLLLSDVWWTLLSCFTDRRQREKPPLTGGFVYRQFLRLLGRKESSVLIPALRTVNIVVHHDTELIKPIIECGTLEHLKDHLVHCNTTVVMLSCRFITSITLGTDDYTEDLFREGLFDSLMKLLVKDECSINMKATALYAISGSMSSQNDEQIRLMVQKGCIRPLCDLLHIVSTEIKIRFLQALRRILEVGKEYKTHVNVNGKEMTYAQAIKEADGWEVIDFLRNHWYFKISHLSGKLLKYWTEEEDGYSTEEEDGYSTEEEDEASP